MDAISALNIHGDIDTGDSVRVVLGSGQLSAAIILHLHDGVDGVATVVIQLGILFKQTLGVLGQVKRCIIAQSFDTLSPADLHYGVKRRTADAVMQCAVDGGQGNVDGKSELTHTFILPRDFRANNFSQIIHK